VDARPERRALRSRGQRSPLSPRRSWRSGLKPTMPGAEWPHRRQFDFVVFAHHHYDASSPNGQAQQRNASRVISKGAGFVEAARMASCPAGPAGLAFSRRSFRSVDRRLREMRDVFSGRCNRSTIRSIVPC